MLNENRLRTQLNAILENEYEGIRKHVAQEALEYYSIEAFFKDLLAHGCRCGMTTYLNHHTQTHEFFDRFYHEIEELRQGHEAITGTPLDMRSDLKNSLAWFAFEKRAYQMATELHLIK